MFGKYHDNRVYQHFFHTYSRVPYLDAEIFNVDHNTLKDSQKANLRVSTAVAGLKRTQEKSEQLSSSIKESRARKEQQAREFLADLQKSQEESLRKQKQAWSSFEQEREESQVDYLKEQKYLESLLKSNSTKAESRLASVRRWH